MQLVSEPGEPVEYETVPIDSHVRGKKVIPSGFFSQPRAEHISAVVFSNAGTYAKFGRIGFQDTEYPGVVMFRYGVEWDPNRTAVLPKPFGYLIRERYETWGEGVVVHHNPRALRRVPPHFFGDAVQYWFDTTLRYESVPFHPFSSKTVNLAMEDQQAVAVRRMAREWLSKYVRATAEAIPALEAEFRRCHQEWAEQHK